jgi:uncharacterized membrane protein
MITLQHVYVLVGSLFVVFAYLSVRDTANPKRWTTGLFWALFALSFLAGDYLGDLGNGVLVLSMALIAGGGGLGVGKPATTSPEERQASSQHWGNWLLRWWARLRSRGCLGRSCSILSLYTACRSVIRSRRR